MPERWGPGVSGRGPSVVGMQDEVAAELEELFGPHKGEVRLRKAIRFGVLRASGHEGTEFKPVATVGIAKDGGVFVAPAAIGTDWTYGPVGTDGLDPRDLVTTSERPKLHYHRSGIASATLTGADIRRSSGRLAPLAEVDRGQVLSIVTVLPAALASVESDRKGDVMAVVDDWPVAVGFSLSVVVAPDDARHPLLLPGLSPMGLDAMDSSRFLVSLGGYGLQALLIGTLVVADGGDVGPHPGTSVTAVEWTPDRTSIKNAFGLWTAALGQPVVLPQPHVPERMPSPGELVVRDRPLRNL